MKVLQRLILILGLLALFGLPTALAQDTTEITVWTLNWNDTVMGLWDNLIAEFEEANPEISVNVENRATDAHKDALRIAAGTDGAPDIYFMWAGLGLGGEFVQLGVSEPLDAAYDALGWGDRFVGSAITKASYLDQLHGVPYTVHGMVVYYRKDLFEQAGIMEEPTTYDELIAANDALIEAGITPFAFGGSVNWHLMRLADSLLETMCGAETHDALKALELSWADEPCATEAFVELARWNEAGYLGENFMGIGPSDASLLVYTDQAAMMLEGDWMVNSISDEGQDLENYGIFPFPSGTDRLYFFAEMLYVTAGSPNRDASIKFLDFISSPETQQKYLGNFGAISVAKDIDYGVDRRPLDEEWSEIFATLTNVYEPGDQAFPLAVNTEFWRIQNGVLTGDVDPNEAAAILQEFIDNNTED